MRAEAMLDDTVMLKEAMRCVHGTLDFDLLAAKLSMSNGEAMRKRFRRFFERDGEPITMVGCTLDYGEGQKFIATATTSAMKCGIKRPRKTGSTVNSKPKAAVYENIPETESQKNTGSDDERDAERSSNCSAESTLSRVGVPIPREEDTISGSSQHDEPSEAQPQHVLARLNNKHKADRNALEACCCSKSRHRGG